MTGSRWRAAASCGRGLPLIAPTLGRSVDHVALANGTLVVPYSLTCAVEAIEGMQQYQFVQTQADVVELRVVPNVEFIDPVRAERQVPHREVRAGPCNRVERALSSGADESAAARAEADAAEDPHRPRLAHVAGYGALRSFVEGLYGVRGVVLAGVLGAELFGLWSLVRIVQQYLTFASLGIPRGLEVEISAASGRTGAAAGEAPAFGRSAVAYTLAVFGALSLLAAAAALLAPDAGMQLVLGGLALGLLAERLWFYVTIFMRASGLLWRFAWYELAHATLHLLLAVALGAAFGLWGAFAGFLLAHLAGVALASRHAPLRPAWSRDHLGPLVRIGFPVSVSALLYTALVSVDRLMVGAFAGVEALGQYAFAVAVSGIGIVIGHVIRTVLFPEVFHLARRAGVDASSDYLDQALLPIAWVLSPVFCLAALALGPAIELMLPSYAAAVPAARLFIFIGVVQGLAMVASLGVVASGRQRVLPWLTGAAFVANLLLSVGVLALGLGLEILAATGLLCRTAYALALVLAARRVTDWRRRQRIVLRLSVPIALCAAIALLLGHVFPDPDLRETALVLGLYVLGVAPLIRGVLRGMRQARRVGRPSA